MTDSVPRGVLTELKKLALLPEEVKQSRWAVSITRLTILKSLCQDHDVADRFVTVLARRTRERVEEKLKQPGSLSTEEWARHREMIDRAVMALEHYPSPPRGGPRGSGAVPRTAAERTSTAGSTAGRCESSGTPTLLPAEYARTALSDQASLPVWAYQTARHYAERTDSRHAEGLTPASVPLLQDIADFWLVEFNLDLAALNAPARQKKAKKGPTPATRSGKRQPAGKKKARFTPRQGQYLAFIHLDRKLHRQAPAEHELVSYFRVSPPAVHSMIVRLEEMGLITREAGVPHSARVAVSESEIPALEDVTGPPWPA
jgi:hypothetical protein